MRIFDSVSSFSVWCTRYPLLAECKITTIAPLARINYNRNLIYQVTLGDQITTTDLALTIWNTIMLAETFFSSIRAQQRSANTAIAKDVGIYLHELHPSSTIKSSYKKSSTPVNALAVSSTHIFAAQADKAVVHVYSRERGNQEALISFPERIHCATLIGDGVLVLGTAEGRIILWEVSVCVLFPSRQLLIS